MNARCPMLFTAIVATSLLLSTIGGTTPHYIWNASSSVPIGLYRVQATTRLAVTELVAVQPPDLLAAFLDLNGYLPIGVPMLKRVLALPGQTVCRNGLKIAVDGVDVGETRERDGRNRPSASSLAWMPRDRGSRCLCHELAVRGLARQPILRTAACICCYRQSDTCVD
jgi:type IV secretory pathway protease TraF